MAGERFEGGRLDPPGGHQKNTGTEEKIELKQKKEGQKRGRKTMPKRIISGVGKEKNGEGPAENSPPRTNTHFAHQRHAEERPRDHFGARK